MIEVWYKYNKDLGKIPESLLLIEKYEKIINKIKNLEKVNYDYNKQCIYK